MFSTAEFYSNGLDSFDHVSVHWWTALFIFIRTFLEKKVETVTIFLPAVIVTAIFVQFVHFHL